MRRICFALMPVFLVSCSKTEIEPGTYKGDFALSGTVRDEISGKPIPFATAMIMRKHRDAGWGGMSVLEKTQADSLGQFKLEFNADTRDYVYSLDANALTYFDKNLDGSDRIDFAQEQHIQQDVTLIPYGYLARIIKGIKGGHSLSINWNGGGGVYYAGTDSLSVVYKIPMTHIYSVYTVRDVKNNIISQVYDTLMTYPHDTTYYLIEF